MADTNPQNFANLPKDKVQEIASMGGKASHRNDSATTETTNDSHVKELAEAGRNPDGTFMKNTDAAAIAGHKGGLHAHGEEDKGDGRRVDGTFLPGSEAAKEAGHVGGLHAHGEKAEDEKDKEKGRREDGTFKPDSEAAEDAGHKGGVAAAATN